MAREQLRASLPAVLDGRLSSVSAETAQMLRAAALLGRKFAVSDLSVVLCRPVVDLAAGLREAAGAGIVDGTGAGWSRVWLVQVAPRWPRGRRSWRWNCSGANWRRPRRR